LSDDHEALALAKYEEDKKEEVDIYVQHVPSQPKVVHFICGGGLEEEVSQAYVVGEAKMVADKDVFDEAEVVADEDVLGEPEVVADEDVLGEQEVWG